MEDRELVGGQAGAPGRLENWHSGESKNLLDQDESIINPSPTSPSLRVRHLRK